MPDYKNILWCAADPHKSVRAIELKLHNSHHSIRKAQDAAQKSGTNRPLPDTATNEMRMELLFLE